MIGFITGGVLLLIIMILAILCFLNQRKARENHNIDEIQLVQPQPYKNQDLSGMLFNYPQ